MPNLQHEVVADYATRRNLPPSEARMLDGLRFRGQFPFATIEELHGFYETLRMMLASEEIGEVPQGNYSYAATAEASHD
jgi:hypothetical protein